MRQCAERKKDGRQSSLSDGKQSWTDWRKKEVDIVWTVAVFILTAFICRNRSETLLEWSSSGNLSVACIIVEVGSDKRKRRWNCADGDRMDPGNTAGTCDFSDGDSSGGSGWGPVLALGMGRKANFLLCRFYWPDIWCSISENGKQMKRFVNIKKELKYGRDRKREKVQQGSEANQIKKRDRRRKKGSLTVEASLVVPLCVMILTFLLSLYVYLRCWYTQAACKRSSVQGSGYGVLG